MLVSGVLADIVLKTYSLLKEFSCNWYLLPSHFEYL